ncbi:helix-turn-helix transcriptional regulator [Halogeometricum limi]|uniref:Predicted transcriptional regulator, contains HTH domain n=1 Tax=Halogeometricum limi TaxID=555875 RepID=A0A1I6IRR8_9EURY|nr:GntR family transcriptional regulator [Halogeometricum limi]SFR69339.1 Predicted transcriptional regulator, contains HTH domain [Halogeometricum limi]
MSRRSAPEVLSLVGDREDVLRHVGLTGRRKRDLAEAMALSRSTLDRAIRELADAGLVERGEEGYARTLCGQLALEEYDRAVRRVEGIVSGSAVVGSLDAETAFDAAVLAGADVVEAKRPSPQEPLRRLGNILERADHADAFSPAIFPTQVDTYHRRVVHDGLTANVLVTGAVTSRLVSSYSDETKEALQTGRLEVRWTTDLPPYSLLVAETPSGPELGILTYDDTGILGFVGNDTSDAVAWGRREHARRWDDAEPLPDIAAD